jgi:hypothetical protein
MRKGRITQDVGNERGFEDMDSEIFEDSDEDQTNNVDER